MGTAAYVEVLLFEVPDIPQSTVLLQILLGSLPHREAIRKALWSDDRISTFCLLEPLIWHVLWTAGMASLSYLSRERDRISLSLGSGELSV